MIDVSVIIPTFNEEHNIANCLESIVNQTFPRERMEIIVVDGDSDVGFFSETANIALRYTDAVYPCSPGVCRQKNDGVSRSSGTYILNVDADMILSENVVRECFDKCENEGYDALYIPERIIGEGFWIQVRNFERSFYNSTCIDGLRFMRRDKFLESGGFDPSIIAGEPWDLDMRLKPIVGTGIIEAPLYHNEGKFDVYRYLRKKARYSTSFHRYISKWGEDNPAIRKQFGIWYRYFGVFLENGKWMRLVSHPILATGMYYLRFMVGIGFLKHRRTYEKQEPDA